MNVRRPPRSARFVCASALLVAVACGGDESEHLTDSPERKGLLFANSEMAVAEVDGKIYVIGGSDDPLPTPVHGVTGAAFVGGLIDIPGGGTRSGGSSGSVIHQVYHPEVRCD